MVPAESRNGPHRRARALARRRRTVAAARAHRPASGPGPVRTATRTQAWPSDMLSPAAEGWSGRRTAGAAVTLAGAAGGTAAVWLGVLLRVETLLLEAGRTVTQAGLPELQVQLEAWVDSGQWGRILRVNIAK